MKNKRIIGTIVTVALGLSLVGAANANSLENLMSKTTESMQPQVRMTQEEMNKNMQSISDSSTVKEDKKADVKVQSKEKKTDENNIRMNPNMPNQSEMWKAMDEVHQGNYESMLEMHEIMSEVHESMPHNQMHNSGMNRHMMGR